MVSKIEKGEGTNKIKLYVSIPVRLHCIRASNVLSSL